ncbi:MAG: PAS domain S-box protein [Candidatus Gracilibacteria bacterium]|nr:PAS domain S-box protein [Candidatus Gracilibacteria bacterium]
MSAKEFKLLFQKHEARILAYYENFLRQHYLHFDDKTVARFLRNAKQILQISQNFNGKEISQKEQQIIDKIVKEEVLIGMNLDQALKLKMVLRSGVFLLLSKEVIAAGETQCLKFLEWYDKVSQHVSVRVIETYEDLYLKNVSSRESAYKSLLDRSFDLILVITANGTFEYFNKQVEVFSGYSRSHLKKMHYTELFHPGDHDKLKKLLNGISQEKTPLALRLLTKQNATKNIMLEIIKRSKGQRVLALECVGRDLSVDESQKARLDERYKKMQEAYIELGKVNRQTSFLQELCVSLATDQDLTEGIRYILYVLATFLEADNVVLRELGPQKVKLIFIAAHNLEEEWEKVKFIKNKKNIDWDAVDSGKIIYVPDLKYDNIHKHHDLVKKHGFQSAISLPIYFRGEIIAVITAFSNKVDSFYEYQEDFVGALLGQLSVAVIMSKTLVKK